MHRIETWPHLALRMDAFRWQDLTLRLAAFRWRARARELLLRADTMHDADARLKIREVAVGYERLAKRVASEVPR